MNATTEQIARARLEAINNFLISKDVRENEGLHLRLLKGGFVPEIYLQDMKNYIEQYAEKQSTQPLTNIEQTTLNTWFSIHPEKMAGKMEKTTSLMFPLRCNGTVEQVKEMFEQALNLENESKSGRQKDPTPPRDERENTERERRMRLAKARAKALKLKAEALLMLQS